jgi:hypothetical protein
MMSRRSFVYTAFLTLALLLAAACSTPPSPVQQLTPADPPPTRPGLSPTQPAATAPPTQPTQPSSGAAPAGPQLAFLHDGDIWLLDHPGGEAYQLTIAGDLLSFAWSPDGERLAAFNGTSLCFFQRDGSIRTACLELGLDEQQSQVERAIVWSPNQNWIVLWNPNNPWDEDTIGWVVVALDTTNAMWRIQDPVDWGAALAPNNEPGGVTGQPLFLADNRLVGTLTHRYLCASGGCRYQLFEFDLNSLSPTFTPFPNQPEEGWSEG